MWYKFDDINVESCGSRRTDRVRKEHEINFKGIIDIAKSSGEHKNPKSISGSSTNWNSFISSWECFPKVDFTQRNHIVELLSHFIILGCRLKPSWMQPLHQDLPIMPRFRFTSYWLSWLKAKCQLHQLLPVWYWQSWCEQQSILTINSF